MPPDQTRERSWPVLPAINASRHSARRSGRITPNRRPRRWARGPVVGAGTWWRGAIDLATSSGSTRVYSISLPGVCPKRPDGQPQQPGVLEGAEDAADHGLGGGAGAGAQHLSAVGTGPVALVAALGHDAFDARRLIAQPGAGGSRDDVPPTASLAARVETHPRRGSADRAITAPCGPGRPVRRHLARARGRPDAAAGV